MKMLSLTISTAEIQTTTTVFVTMKIQKYISKVLKPRCLISMTEMTVRQRALKSMMVYATGIFIAQMD